MKIATSIVVGALGLMAGSAVLADGRLGTAREQRVIRSAYSKLAKYATSSGHPISFRLTGFTPTYCGQYGC